jgi:hypothetical protein
MTTVDKIHILVSNGRAKLLKENWVDLREVSILCLSEVIENHDGLGVNSMIPAGRVTNVEMRHSKKKFS